VGALNNAPEGTGFSCPFFFFIQDFLFCIIRNRQEVLFAKFIELFSKKPFKFGKTPKIAPNLTIVNSG